jgi:hypothetical protein
MTFTEAIKSLNVKLHKDCDYTLRGRTLKELLSYEINKLSNESLISERNKMTVLTKVKMRS